MLDNLKGLQYSKKTITQKNKVPIVTLKKLKTPQPIPTATAANKKVRLRVLLTFKRKRRIDNAPKIPNPRVGLSPIYCMIEDVIMAINIMV
jgi:hypothetical protein